MPNREGSSPDNENVASTGGTKQTEKTEAHEIGDRSMTVAQMLSVLAELPGDRKIVVLTSDGGTYEEREIADVVNAEPNEDDDGYVRISIRRNSESRAK